VVRVDGTSTRVLYVIRGCDGSQEVYHAELVPELGSPQRIAFNADGEIFWLDPAPLGTSVAVLLRDSSPYIYLVDPAQNAAEARPIELSDSAQHGHAWLPDGSGMLLFSAPISSSLGELWWVASADSALAPIDLREHCGRLPVIDHALPNRWGD
jgi:hypothetical protein